MVKLKDAVKEFEKKFADYIGVKHAIATNSGTSAEHIILQSLGIGPGDEVIVPAITFFSTAASVLHQNAIPIFADIEWNTVNIDPIDFKNKITEKTKAVIPVHLYGSPAEMDQIMEIAEKIKVSKYEATTIVLPVSSQCSTFRLTISVIPRKSHMSLAGIHPPRASPTMDVGSYCDALTFSAKCITFS